MVKSKKTHATLDSESRLKKAVKIISILEKRVPLNKCRVLDVGTGSGYIISEIAKKCKSAYSVDVTDERAVHERYKFKKVISEKLPYQNNFFDVVISNYVIEHVANQKKHLNEIYRVLKKGGILYLGIPNRYYIIDDHYKLPFITWFPRKISRIYLRIFNNKKWDIYPISKKKLYIVTAKKFNIDDLTYDIIKNPSAYKLDSYKPIQSITKIFPVFILKSLKIFIPSYIMVLTKK